MRAMIEIARNYRNGPIKRKEITRTQHISHAYLEQILIALKNRHLIRTARGANGGYELESQPSKINALQIVLALEGSITPVEEKELKALSLDASESAAAMVWQKLAEAQMSALEGVSLQDMLDREQAAAGQNYEI
jgi:Rrf2 family cysteine metabolism transcriptional repressor